MAGAAQTPAVPSDGSRSESVRRQAARAFSAVAPLYDHETEPNPIVRWVRRRTIQRLSRLFHPGDMVLELGCGTGVEAVALAALGIRVVATDVAPGMVATTRERVRASGLDGLVTVQQLAAARVGELLATYPAGSFAGAYSSFGPLNCEPELEQFAGALHDLLRPGGVLAISVINRFHLFEFAWYTAHGDLRRATRRWSGFAEGTVSPTLPDRVATYYYTPGAFVGRLPGFRLRRCRALLLLLPPPYLAHLTQRFPRLFRLAARVETRVAGWPLLRGLGDHVYVELERVS